MRRRSGRVLFAIAVALPALAAAPSPGESPASLRLAPVEAPPAAELPRVLVAGEALPQAELDELLARLSPQGPERAPAPVERPWPGAPTPPLLPLVPVSRAGSPAAAPRRAGGPLRVVAHHPEGEAARAAEIAVTFSQAMDTGSTPLRISPELPGSYRWAQEGRTLVFAPERGLPPAARLAVSVPAGARAASGERLAAEERFEVRTAPPATVDFLPYGGRAAGPRPVVLVKGDHDLTWGDVAPLVSLEAGGRTWPVREATDEEVEADPFASAEARRLSFVGITPVEDLPAGVEAKLCLRTPPTRPRARPDWIRCHVFRADPREPPRQGPSKGSPRGPPPSFHLPGDGTLVVLPAPAGALTLYSSGLSELRVRVHAVAPADWPAYVGGLEANPGTASLPDSPGRLVVDTTLAPHGQPGAVERIAIDLSPALRGGRGHAVVTVDAPEPRGGGRRFARTWVQATELSLEANPEEDRLRVVVSSLAAGRGLEGVAVALGPDGGRAVTGADGTATLPFPVDARADRVVRAARVDDVAFVPAGLPGLRVATWERRDRRPALAWRSFQATGALLPGMPLRLRGWVGPDPAGAARTGAVEAVEWLLDDGGGGELARGEARVAAGGSFDLELELPAVVVPGDGRLRLSARGRDLAASEPYVLTVPLRRAEPDRVAIELAPAPRVEPGASVELEATVRDATGGGLSGRRVDWSAAAPCRETGRTEQAWARTRTGVDGRTRVRLEVERSCDRPNLRIHVTAAVDRQRGASDSTDVRLEPGGGAGAPRSAPRRSPGSTLDLRLELPPEVRPGGGLEARLRASHADGAPAVGAQLALAASHPAISGRLGETFGAVTTWTAPPGPTRFRVSLRDHLPGPEPPDAGRLSGQAASDAMRARTRAPPRPAPAPPRAGTPARAAPFHERPPVPLVADPGEPPVSFETAVADAAGEARVRFVAPDSGGALRVRAVAVRGDAIGGVSADVPLRGGRLARLPPLGTLRTGDRFLVPIRLENPSASPVEVRLAVRARGLSLPEGAGRRVTVPPRSVADVRLPAVAGWPGAAALDLVAVEGATVERASLRLDVAPAGGPRLVASGSLGRAGAAVRTGAASDERSLVEVTAGAAPAVELLESVPGDELPACPDAVAARLLARASLVPGLGGAAGRLGEAAAADAVALAQATTGFVPPPGCGGPRLEAPQFLAAAEALLAARAAGVRVDAPALASLVDRARALGTVGEEMPRRWSPRSDDRTLVARALHVLHRAGEDDPLRAAQRLRDAGPGGLSTEELAFLLPVLAGGRADARHAEVAVAELLRRGQAAVGGTHLRDRGDEPAAGEEGSVEGHRGDAIALAALQETRLASALAAGLREHLLAVRGRRGWGTPGDSALAISALSSASRAPPPGAPVVEVWAAGRRVGSTRAGAAPLWIDLATVGGAELRLAADGPTAVRLVVHGPTRAGTGDLLAVERTYEAISDPADVRRGPDGSWRLRAGALVRVRLTVFASRDVPGAMLVDEIPAGLVPVEAADGAALRAGRLEAFLPGLRGPRSVHYTARAAVRGEFTAAPAAVRGAAPGLDADGVADLVRIE